LFDCCGWIVLHQKAQEGSPTLFQRGGMRPNVHPLNQRRCASGDGPCLAVYFDNTQAACADGRETSIITERRNVGTHGP
jgi:hypothetical protein